MKTHLPHEITESKVSDKLPSTAPPSGATTQTYRGSTLAQSTSTPAPSSLDGPGQVLGDYELLDKLGAGGMGVVYRARQRSANRIVALKVIRPECLAALSPDTRAETLQRFVTEAQAAARLEHDHIVTVHDVGEVDGQPFYSMRYVEGRSLGQIMRDGPLENRRAAEVLEPIARAVHYAHERGILHRDLKPVNIMVDAAGRPFVADFGLAKLTENASDITRSGQVMGTPSYMSPEQAQDASRCTIASDTYSLGATLYDLLTGRPPFRAATVVETLKQVIDQDPVSPRQLNPAIDHDLETITLKCLQKEPARRYASAAELAEDLDHYLRSEPILARPVGFLERSFMSAKRQPVIAVSLGLLGILVSILLEVISMQSELWALLGDSFCFALEFLAIECVVGIAGGIYSAFALRQREKAKWTIWVTTIIIVLGGPMYAFLRLFVVWLIEPTNLHY